MIHTEEQVRAIWNTQLLKAKGSIAKGELLHKDGRLPEMWPGYNDAIAFRRSLLPHIEVGEPADHLFDQRSPNMSERERDYLLANFKQTTLPIYTDFSNTLNRGLSEGNWSIKYTDPQGPFAEYVGKGIREWGSVWNFFRNAYLSIKISDAMGVIAVLPEHLEVVKVVDVEKLVSAEQVEPVPVYYDCSRVWGFRYDQWYILRLEKSSRVNKGRGGEGDPGVLCIFVDSQSVWSIKQTGRDSEQTYDIVKEYDHNCGEAPVIHNRGRMSNVNSYAVWKSPYLDAIGCLDLALMDANMLQASKNKLMYPHMVVAGSTCDYVDSISGKRCLVGTITYQDPNDGSDVRKECPKCLGMGKLKNIGPLGEVVFNPRNEATGENTGMRADSVLAFIGPETATATVMRSEIDVYTKQARQILHVDAEAPMAGGDAKTATQSGLDSKARDAFVKPIIDQTFTAFEFVLECIAKQRNEADPFVLQKPTTYDLRSPEEFLLAAQDAMEKGMPQHIVDDLLEQWIAVKYKDDPASIDLFTSISKADRLSSMPWEQVTAKQASGQIKPWEAYLHDSAKSIYWELYDREPSFSGLDNRAKADKMIEAAKAATATTPVISMAERLSVVTDPQEEAEAS